MTDKHHERQKTNIKVYRGEWLDRRGRELYRTCLVFLARHNWKHAKTGKPVSHDYQRERAARILRTHLIDYRDAGFRPTSIAKSKRKHHVGVLRLWERQGMGAGMMRKKYGDLVWIAKILNKTDICLEKPWTVLDDPERWKVGTVARVEKTLSAHGVDFADIIGPIAEHSPLVAVIQLAKLGFGLRTKEAIMLHPHEDDRGTYLAVTRGTKGGRPRTVSYYDFEGRLDEKARQVVLWNLRENRLRVQVLDLAKSVVLPGHSMIPPSYTLGRFRRYERYVTERYGRLTRKELGVTPHALRHEFLCLRAEAISGLIRPLRRAIKLDAEDAVRDRVARQVAAIDAGHHDTYTTETYYGPRTERAPPGAVKTVAECLIGPTDEPLIKRARDGSLIPGEGRRIVLLDQPPEGEG